MNKPGIKRWIPVLATVGLGAIFACGDDDDTDDPNNDGIGEAVCESTCGGSNLCVNDTCTAAFPRTYTIRIRSVHFAPKDVNGNCWDDPGCGAPDPVVEIKLNDTQVAQIDDDDDTFDANYSRAFDVDLNADSRVEISLEDQDLVEEQNSVVCRYEPITAAKIRDGDLGCEMNGSRIEATIAPKTGVES